jgi:glycosyltransferase involved in cell wall biosynthesis
VNGDPSSLPNASGVLNFLWIIDFEYGTRLHHGALLRYFNFSPELIAHGHSVTFAVNFLDQDRGPSIQYFRELKAQGVFTDFIETNFEPQPWRIRVAAWLIYPGFANFILRSVQRRFAAQIDAIGRNRGSDVIIISGLRLLFVPQRSESDCGFVYDLGDCKTLFSRRQLRLLAKNRDFFGLLRALKPSLFGYMREHYYGRMQVTKIMVSPVDKVAIDAISGKPDTSTVVLNGVREGSPQGKYSKTPGRIIFTGNMNFAPNYEAALWFLDKVLPLVLRQRPDVCFVIAGANPIPTLLERASKNVAVTGFVADLNREIACSEVFVAPLVSGGGFKNKVLEAIVNRTSVVATSIAVEFFPPAMRHLLTVADAPSDMAEAIMAVWRNPQEAEARTEMLHELAMAQFGWAGRASELVEIVRKTIAQTRVGGGL